MTTTRRTFLRSGLVERLGALAKLQFDHYDGSRRWNGPIAYPLFDHVLEV